MADQSEGIEVPVVWVGVEELPILFVNQWVAQVDRGEVFLVAGQLQPPALVGTEGERREQAQNIQFIGVKPVARLEMTPSRLRELISVLEITLSNYEKQSEVYGDPRTDS